MAAPGAPAILGGMKNEPIPMAGAPPRLFDEHGRPDFREVYGGLLRSAAHLDVALTRIRLSTLHLAREDLARLRSIRLLLAEVSAMSLEVEAHAVMLRADKRETLGVLARLLAEGVIEVRSAPLGGWAPDFSVFRSAEGAFAVLLGFHWFERPFPHRGPALASLHGPEGARLARVRFEDLWRRAHDISPAVLGILARAERGREAALANAEQRGEEPQEARRAEAPEGARQGLETFVAQEVRWSAPPAPRP